MYLIFKIIYIYDLSACDTVHWGVNCNQSCDCTQNSLSCDPKFGCKCKAGWNGTYCEVNIDECQGQNPCKGLEDCIDTPGSYVCQCKVGYQRNDTTGDCESRSLNVSGGCRTVCRVMSSESFLIVVLLCKYHCSWGINICGLCVSSLPIILYSKAKYIIQENIPQEIS